MPEADAVTHTPALSRQLTVDSKPPHSPPGRGEDSILVVFDDSEISMQRNDGQQFVACVKIVDQQIYDAFEVGT